LLRTSLLKLSAQPITQRSAADEVKDEALIRQDTPSKRGSYGSAAGRAWFVRQAFYTTRMQTCSSACIETMHEEVEVSIEPTHSGSYALIGMGSKSSLAHLSSGKRPPTSTGQETMFRLLVPVTHFLSARYGWGTAPTEGRESLRNTGPRRNEGRNGRKSPCVMSPSVFRL
jgi:hypothetical protein